ncbi:hypothetical protein E2C01_063114 [Portunus trituberculatus]|uniref:Uncharacterized protein n=1 Tax=Portunus trituberculatus TaxID=210409 RepID=A0A5B7HFI0_PORTR|nr:hypothetical protein [Portunus trituberculatus]
MSIPSHATDAEVKEREQNEKGKQEDGYERRGEDDAGTDYIKTVTGWKSERKEKCDEILWKDTVTRQESESKS